MSLPRPFLPAGEHLITFDQLRELNGFDMPVRPYVRKLRPLGDPHYPGWVRESTIISGFVYPWVVADRNNEKWDLWAYQTWEDAYAKAYTVAHSRQSSSESFRTLLRQYVADVPTI